MKQKQKKSILFYYPMDFEVNVKKTLFLMRRMRVKVYLPFMEKESFKMVEFRLPLKKKKFEIFEPFQEEELLNLLSMSKIRKYNPGEKIFKQGSSDTWLYFLVYGKVRLMKDGKPMALLQRRLRAVEHVLEDRSRVALEGITPAAAAPGIEVQDVAFPDGKV